ncbi:hypothetical protein [Saccharibacillus alkalitolerans]|uniref:Uncharacterized protein n=1 Tax=Saccharibacillus alkalitolerans TaxID=2705290 RepID=A0ABX0F5C4_9BACL|nr:hypothetical protein [Saccharibacillus alkalitolerans]NGZ74396.1 hypothetical protein [Saccharibacillus alkalitolerans]
MNKYAVSLLLAAAMTAVTMLPGAPGEIPNVHAAERLPELPPASELQRLEDVYGLSKPHEPAQIPIGDFAFSFGGISGGFSGSDLRLSETDGAVRFLSMFANAAAPLPASARLVVLLLNGGTESR